ncbi:MAG TPA: Hsp20/alpha crystallin family protein [Ktedonobacteraceae bacterium]|nr:Hsp20/alpha crystallin family protein [Ktedonobacteraceae bacterium]
MIWKDPSEGFMSLRQAMDRMFEESFLSPGRFALFTGRTFPVDVYESKDQKEYVVEASLPGVKPEEIEITSSGDTLTITYATRGEEKVEKPKYVRRERYEDEMSRTFTLPTQIDPEKVQATYEHGVLTLHVPKAETARPKQIPVKVKEAVGTR